MSTPIDDGGPAFPSVCLGDPGHPASIPGMSLRDWLAGQALAGEIAAHSDDTLDIPCGKSISEALAIDAKRRAEWCYQQADAMLAARKGGQPHD